MAKTDRFRPVFGGIQIESIYDGVRCTSTLGFAATRADVKGFVMSGHAGDPGTPVYQPVVTADNYLSDVRVRAPRPTAYSDSGWVAYENVRPYIYSDISITGYDYVVGSKTTAETAPGDPVYMQGRTSCGMSGKIIREGVKILLRDRVTGEVYELINQVEADFKAAQGDSGPTYYVVRLAVKPD